MGFDGIKYRFEELPAFLDPHGDTQAGQLDGWAEIEFRAAHDWRIIDIALEVHNGARGEACRTGRFWLDRAAHAYLWQTIARGLERICADSIADAILARIDERATA